MHVATVVVTFNRLELLQQCLGALCAQTRPPDSIYVVDNASTDGTTGWLRDGLPTIFPGVAVVFLGENTGGAGGFSRGLDEAVRCGADWVWMMDDDALPHPTSLEELLLVCDEPGNVYGSLAVCGDVPAWTTTLVGHGGCAVGKVADVPARAGVDFLPFLGFMIHRTLVDRIGLPDAGFFILSDDTEYCLRARSGGAAIVLAGHSHIEHPQTERRYVRLPFRRITYLSLPPWKRYYHTRNKILIARRYFGIRLLTQTIPGLLARFVLAMVHEPDRPAQALAFFAGAVDGLAGRTGRRHEKWHIRW